MIRTSNYEFDALSIFALDWHQQEQHAADMEACEDPICALANAVAGVDPEAGTFLPGNHAITITVEAGEINTFGVEPIMDERIDPARIVTDYLPVEDGNGGDGIEIQPELDELVAQGRIITDGFQQYWSAFCPVCGEQTMQVVRPGKVQCAECSNVHE